MCNTWGMTGKTSGQGRSMAKVGKVYGIPISGCDLYIV